MLNNWLVNPTGKEDGFRGVDWLVELNNLYTKVIYGGSGSNYTLKRVLEESILIDLYRQCHVSVENGFFLLHRTIRHSPPDMTKTLVKLGQHYSQIEPHVFKTGRKSYSVMIDLIWEGISIYSVEGMMEVEKDGSDDVDGEGLNTIEPADLIH